LEQKEKRRLEEKHARDVERWEEQKRLHDLTVTKHREAKVAALEAMGFKSNKATLEHYFWLWEASQLEGKETRYLKMKHQRDLDEAAEKHRLYEIQVRRKKEAMVAAMECMGARNDHTRLLHYFLMWSYEYFQAAEGRFLHEKHLKDIAEEQEKHRVYEIQVRRKKEAMVAAMEAMGCRNDHSRLLHHILLWSYEYFQAKESRYLSNKQAREQADALEKHRLYEIQVRRKKEAMVAAMEALGCRNDHSRLLHHFLLWSYEYFHHAEARYLKKAHLQEQEELAEKHRIAEMRVRQKKEAVCAALEALGCRNSHSRLMHHFLLWSYYYFKASEARYLKRKHDHSLDKALLYWGETSRTVLLGVCMNEWHMLLPDKLIAKLQRDSHEKNRLRRKHYHEVRLLANRFVMHGGTITCHVAFGAWHKDTIRELEKRGGRMRLKKNVRLGGDIMNKAISKWADGIPHLWLHAVLRALWQEVAEARKARGQFRLREVKGAWKSKSLDSASRFVTAMEEHTMIGTRIKTFVAWRAAAFQQRAESLSIECSSLQEKVRYYSSEAMSAQRAGDALRTQLAVNILAAEQRAEDNLEISDKLGVVTGSLQGEMHTHNLTLDALEHEVLLLEAKLTGSDLYRKQGSNPSLLNAYSTVVVDDVIERVVVEPVVDRLIVCP